MTDDLLPDMTRSALRAADVLGERHAQVVVLAIVEALRLAFRSKDPERVQQAALLLGMDLIGKQCGYRDPATVWALEVPVTQPWMDDVLEVPVTEPWDG